ncbi:MAG: thiamine pyrophosphate-dependent dehydrogenase E1 component subunit alpha [Planctomycetota bacterium]|nr:thiamine pyrophosphate-dependent dehydrogenase E1 component subunit alpha [Planctomycetota bacterium]
MAAIRTLEQDGVALLRALEENGSALRADWTGEVPDDEQALAIWRAMLTTRLLDDRMLKLQRQGRVAFVGTSTGSEAAIHGSAAAFAAEDWIFSGLREGGAAVQRGMPIAEYVAHMFGNAEDTAKGRQMPNHFQCREANFVSWSSVIGTQLPHAAGVALAFRRRSEPKVVCGYCGDGATSSSGFHSALNFAAVYKAPIVFVVIDNGWAISVPSAKQTSAISYGAKARAYGMPGVDVDGNDFVAVLAATLEAAARARRGDGPSLVCLRTYRIGGHSSSDDPTRYREAAEVEYWSQRDPLARAESYLRARGVMDDQRLEQSTSEINTQIAAAVEHAEAVGPPPLETLVEDVYAAPPRHLTRQVVDALRIRDEQGEAAKIQGKFPL